MLETFIDCIDNEGVKDTAYSKMFEGEKFHGFCDFSLNGKCFSTNYGLADWQRKSTSMLPQKFSGE